MMDSTTLTPYISRTLEKALARALGPKIAIHNYVLFVDHIYHTDTGFIAARFSADLTIQIDGGPTYESYIMRSLFDMTPSKGGYDTRIKLVIGLDGKPKPISSSPRINDRITTQISDTIRLDADDLNFIHNRIGETCFSQTTVERRQYVD